MRLLKLILLALMVFTTSLFANIGKITALKGDANILRDSKTIKAKLGFVLENKDKITTGKNSRVQIVFKDKTVVSLGKNSNFDIKEYFFDEKKPQKIKASFKMAKGIFKSITGKIGKINPSKFKLKTKSASIGIRGTTFFGEISPQGKESIACTSGAITVSTPQGSVEVPAGQFTQVSPDSIPTPPAAIAPAQQQNLEKDSGAFENEQESGQNESVVQKQSALIQANTPPQPDEDPVVDLADISKEVENIAALAEIEKQSASQDENPVAKLIATKTTITENAGPSGSDSAPVESSSAAVPSKTATYTALHGSTLLNKSGLAAYGMATGQTSFFEQASNPSYSISNGVLSGSSTLNRTEVINYENQTAGDRTFTLSNTNLSSPATSYTGYTKIKTIPFTVNAFGRDEDMNLNLFADSMQEFFVGHANRQFTPQGASHQYEYDDYLVFGTPTTQLPTDGISRYVEPLTSGHGGAAMKGGNLPYTTSINWKNKRILSYEIGADNDFFIYIGTVGSNGAITHKNYFEVNNAFNQKIVFNSSSSDNKGYIFGSQHQGWGATIGLKANGGGTLITNTIGEFRHPNSSFEKATADTGSVSYEGFTTKSDQLTGQPISFTLNKDAGYISDGLIGASGTLANFGGESTSAYIDNNTFASIIGTSDGWLATIPSRSSESEHFESDHISWGLWAKANATTSVPQPWVAGDISKLVSSIPTSGTATYKGPAMGYITSSTTNGTFIDPTNSSITLVVDFGGGNVNATLQANGSTFYTGTLVQGNFFNAADYSFSHFNGDNRVQGKFYDNMKTTVGSFRFSNNSQIAHGVYKATKQ